MPNKDKLITKLSDSKVLSTKDPFKAFEMANDVLSKAKKEKYNRIKAEAYFHMAYACRVMSKYSQGLDYAFQAMKIFKSKKDNEGILKTSNIIGIIYFYHGDYSRASSYYLKALDLLELVDAPLVKSSALNNMGELHRLSGEWEKANKYYFEALKIANKEYLINNAAIINSNIGEVFYNIYDFDKAELYLKKAYELAIESNNYLAIGEIETKLGNVKFSQNEFNIARTYYESAMAKLNAVNNKYYLIDLFINLSKLEEAEGGLSLECLNEALDISIGLSLQQKTSQIFQLMAEIYEKRKNYKEALSYYKAYHLKEKEIEVGNLTARLKIMSLEFEHSKDKKESKLIRELNSKFKTEIDKSHEELEVIKKENIQLLSENTIDELTQIYNRRGIRRLLIDKTQKSDDKQYAVYIIDVDYFKNYNDTLGHIQGDICLTRIAESLKGLEYEDYFVGRFGGEEFLSYAKVNNLQEAEAIAERIRTTVSDLGLKYTIHGETKYITVSVGAKVSSDNCRDMNLIIRRADEALYKAKDAGRDQVIVG